MEKKILKKNSRKRAIVFGSSGLIGSYLVKQLCKLPDYKEIICINRTPQNFEFSNVVEIINDFSDLTALSKIIKADEVYCCLGTTIKKAGSKENFKSVDFTLPLEIGKACKKNGVDHYLLVSSIGANAESGNFYLQTKGRLEQDLFKLSLPDLSIVRPSMLLGPRKESRFGEEAGKILMKVFSPLMIGKLNNYKAIQAEVVAKSMIIIANSSLTKQQVFESRELQEIVDGEG